MARTIPGICFPSFPKTEGLFNLRDKVVWRDCGGAGGVGG